MATFIRSKPVLMTETLQKIDKAMCLCHWRAAPPPLSKFLLESFPDESICRNTNVFYTNGYTRVGKQHQFSPVLKIKQGQLDVQCFNTTPVALAMLIGYVHHQSHAS